MPILCDMCRKFGLAYTLSLHASMFESGSGPNPSFSMVSTAKQSLECTCSALVVATLLSVSTELFCIIPPLQCNAWGWVKNIIYASASVLSVDLAAVIVHLFV